MTIKAVLTFLIQYASALAIIAGASWYIAKPHAENFVQQSVKTEIDGLKKQVDAAMDQQQILSDKVGILTATIESQSRVDAESSRQSDALKIRIEELLRALPQPSETPQ